MGQYLKTEFRGYLKDSKTNLVINTNMDELTVYKEKVSQYKQMKQFESELNKLKNDVGDIKSLLTELLGKLNV